MALYGYDIRQGSCVIFYVESFKPVMVFNVEDYENYWEMRTKCLMEWDRLVSDNVILPPLEH